MNNLGLVKLGRLLKSSRRKAYSTQQRYSPRRTAYSQRDNRFAAPGTQHQYNTATAPTYTKSMYAPGYPRPQSPRYVQKPSVQRKPPEYLQYPKYQNNYQKATRVRKPDPELKTPRRSPIRVHRHNGVATVNPQIQHEALRLNQQFQYVPRVHIREGRAGGGDGYMPVTGTYYGKYTPLDLSKKHKYYGTGASGGIVIRNTANNPVGTLRHELAHHGVASVTGNKYKEQYSRDDSKAYRNKRLPGGNAYERETEYIATGSSPNSSHARAFSNRRTALPQYYTVDPNFGTVKEDNGASSSGGMDSWELQMKLIDPGYKPGVKNKKWNENKKQEVAGNMLELQEFMENPDAEKFNTPGSAYAKPEHTGKLGQPADAYVSTLNKQGPDYLRRTFRGGTTLTNNGGTKALEAANDLNNPKTRGEVIQHVTNIQTLLGNIDGNSMPYGVAEVINRWGITPDFDMTRAYNVMPLRDLIQLESELRNAILNEPNRQRMNDAVNTVSLGTMA